MSEEVYQSDRFYDFFSDAINANAKAMEANNKNLERIIELLEKLVEPKKKVEDNEHTSCFRCKFEFQSSAKHPCSICEGYDEWEPEEQESK